MTEIELKQTISANIFYYRSLAKLTQAQLAEKLNYSDKSVSKWENADGLPDLVVITRMAEIFGITVNDLISSPLKKVTPAWRKSKILVTLMSLGMVWLISAIAFTAAFLITDNAVSALAFLYAVPVSGIVGLVFGSVWKNRVFSGIFTSFIIWGIIAGIIVSYLLFAGEVLWVYIVIGVPLQVLDVLWFFFREVLYKARASLAASKRKKKAAGKTDKTEKK